MGRRRFGIIGGGLIGLATAIKLQNRLPAAEIFVWEKESSPGQHQSTHNSGVLHAGLYYKPGSLKARLAVQGIREMTAFCHEHGISHDICGKVVVATSEVEEYRLKTLIERGSANGLSGMERLGPEQLKEMEPMAAGIAAVHVPEEGIVDYKQVVEAMRKVLEGLGGSLRLSCMVRQLVFRAGEWTLVGEEREDQCDFLVNCAGLHSDRVARMAGENPSTRIVPFRGEYFQLRPEMAARLKKLIYPVPDPTFPFLGVHLTRLIHGGVEAGPNAVLALAREGYKATDVNLRDLGEALSFPGLWRFLAAHPGMCARELHTSLSKSRFCRELQKLTPEVQDSDLMDGGTGVRAQAMSPDGRLVQDFDFIEREHALHVINAPSPGATASLAIGQHIVDNVCRVAGLS
ncbi:MAG: L-2-hydroxyglutarate oxidase [Verrucomicrobiaceae bacterium]|nr:L-2-hydroxyglutarate oxidase [Verrucomicrobiaceae bacterium]